MTVCPKCKFYNICKGRLNETVENYARFKSVEQINETNEEWLRQATTEQLAEWILDVSDECFDCGKSDNGDCPFGKAQGVCTCINKDSVMEWLKQPHTDKE